jgi:hypothetical protein
MEMQAGQKLHSVIWVSSPFRKAERGWGEVVGPGNPTPNPSPLVGRGKNAASDLIRGSVSL